MLQRNSEFLSDNGLVLETNSVTDELFMAENLLLFYMQSLCGLQVQI